MSNFDKVKDYLMDLGVTILKEDKEKEIFIIEAQEDGISNMLIGIADPIIIMEQYLFDLQPKNAAEVTKELLKKNRQIVHGAFVLDEDGKRVIFRDTLQIETLDLNELEGTLSSLSLLLSEYTDEIISFSKN
ncbi:MAG: YbjN domain-containing protein [Crocinitomicaceae bacterium]|nr:YbjN domain-containing protein [Crocinitomicaceae bacterium]MBK8925433.1 YbjN domain-containing protein [Crocinitomicaceae bacterium]